jgi:hypothetical protein
VPDPPPIEDYQVAFERVRAAVDAGDTDLKDLGFWRLLARVKADPVLAHHWADAAGEIDRRAFETGVKLRAPVWAGNLLLGIGTVVGGVGVAIAMSASSEVVAGLALIAAGGIWAVSVHCLAHWIVGRAVGIRFTWYFVGGPFPPRPGLKTDYATYLRAEPSARAWMHASGAIATKLAPFVALALWPATNAPGWAAWVLLGLGILQIVTDVAFSRTSSDWKKVARERAVARDIRERWNRF